LVVEVKDGFISLFLSNYRKFANQNIYLFCQPKISQIVKRQRTIRYFWHFSPT